MDRRNFFKIVSATSAGALGGCGKKTDKLIPLLVPEHEIVPGEEQWHPAVCGECGAGCGTLVRIMAGVRTVERNGEPFRERVAAIKKIEGNPLDPISGGRLCARGQASVQSLYHPDRLRGPMRRTGQRGQAQFAAVSWEEAIGQAAETISKARAADPARIVFLSGPQAGTRSLAIQRFTQALGAPGAVVCSISDHAVERKAAEMVFGWKGLPVYDLARAQYALGVGADFLGGWASPVYYARQFGAFRQGRRNIRGQLVQAESRLSITAAAADRWLPLRPGSEPQFLAAVGRMLLDAGLARNREALPKTVAAAFQAADAAALLAMCGLEEKRVRQIVQELGESEAPLVLAGASVVHTNSLDAIAASHYINLMLGVAGKPGGILAPGAAAAPPDRPGSGGSAGQRAGGAHRRREPGLHYAAFHRCGGRPGARRTGDRLRAVSGRFRRLVRPPAAGPPPAGIRNGDRARSLGAACRRCGHALCRAAVRNAGRRDDADRPGPQDRCRIPAGRAEGHRRAAAHRRHEL